MKQIQPIQDYQAKDMGELKLMIRTILKITNPEGYVYVMKGGNR